MLLRVLARAGGVVETASCSGSAAALLPALTQQQRRAFGAGAGGAGGGLAHSAAPPPRFPAKTGLVERLLEAKAKSGKSFGQIAKEVGLTNVYTAQLFFNQQQLQPNTAAALKRAVPGLSDADLAAMQRAPHRSFDPTVLQEPALYRIYEALCHGGDSIKALINEHWGDGIMSAIGFYATVDKAVGKEGEPRIIITFNGKFLPYVEQRAEDNIAQRD